MSGFVGEGLDGLGVGDIVADHYESATKVGVAVGAAKFSAAPHVESSFLEEALEAFPQPCWGLAGEEDNLADLGVGQRRSVGLPDVEHSDGLGCDHLGSAHDSPLVVAHRAAGIVESGFAEGDRGEDLDAGLSAAHLAPIGGWLRDPEA
ncbi:hypothetical protein [Tessaracoccus sp. MC1627]|uniref:hypothetical protein n=1 Tax=Tessaracoccus sp. MC1627 TaxID=2760312 RepID=UPI002106C302|nr:hypothetical protein [Tessaracoccus sp. MC1627]